MTNKIKEYNFRKEYENIGFEIQYLNDFFKTVSENQTKQPHRVKFYAILLVTEGKGEHLIDFKKYAYQEKDIIFIGKDQVHAWLNRDKINGFILFFTEDFLHQNQIKFKDLSYSYPYNSLIYKPILSLQEGKQYDTFHALVQYLYQEYHSPNSYEQQEILQCLLRTFILKTKSQSQFKHKNLNIPSSDKALFIQFQKMLDEKLAISRNAKDYCEWLDISYQKLNRICKIFTKMPIKGFIDETLILKTQKELSNRGITISEVAYQFGFDEVTNFTKYFKKHTNLSPKAFQSSHLF
ncbi:MAG: helix-turn-helix domain-containing protein [Saprospiraceae bacterium]